MAEVINGGCHCGNITLCFNISSTFDELPIRACQCSFCRKHNVRATADPNGELEVYIKDKSKLSKYRCLLYTSPSPRDLGKSRMPSSA